MEFNDLNSAMMYIEMIVNSAMPEMGEQIKLIMDEITQQQVGGWTNQIFDSVVSEGFGHEASAEFKDNARWESWVDNSSVGNPIKFLESGSTVGREASDIMETSQQRCEIEIPEKLKEYLQSKGITIE